MRKEKARRRRRRAAFSGAPGGSRRTAGSSSAGTALLVVAVFVVALLVFSQRERIASGATMLVGKIGDAARRAAFKFTLPSYAQHLGDSLLRVSDEDGIAPWTLAALASRESDFGRGLDAQGKGDSGHGHGIFQIDDGSHSAWLARNNWQDPYTNAKKASEIWRAARAFFAANTPLRYTANGATVAVSDGTTVYVGPKAAEKRSNLALASFSPGRYRDPRPLTGERLERAATAAYNTGASNVLQSLALGLDPDITTTGPRKNAPGDYSRNVLVRALRFLPGGTAQA